MFTDCPRSVCTAYAVCSMLMRIRQFDRARSVLKLVQLMGEIMKLCSRLFIQTFKPKQSRISMRMRSCILNSIHLKFETRTERFVEEEN